MRLSLTKIHYVPGFISALIIPLVFWYYGNRKLQEPLPNVMDIGLPPKHNPDILPNDQLGFEPYRDWNYKKILVIPNSAKENSKSYVLEIQNLQKRNVKDTGIEFILTDENSYNDFVAILNDLSIAKHDFYGLDLDRTGHIFALVNYKDPYKIFEPCYLCNDVISIDEGNFTSAKIKGRNLFQNVQEMVIQLPENALFIIFGFLIFLNITILNIKKFL